jgi:hypothetical protein
VPSKKQRRRREKTRRHDYEYVYVDEDGTEVEVDPEEVRKPAREPKDGKQRGRASSRPVRKVSPPSWGRAIKRGGIFAALFVVVFTFVLPHKSSSLPASILLAVVYGAAFVPMIYLTDRMAYRTYLRRTKGGS